MAIGAITVEKRAEVDGAMLERISFAGDNAYATGGTAFAAAFSAAVKSDARDILSVLGRSSAGHTVEFIPASGLLKVYVAAGTEAANAADLSGATFRVLVISK